MKQKIHLIAADMGYGHQRAAYPLLDIAKDDKIVTINNYSGIAEWEEKYWIKSLDSYEKISRLKKVPLLGKLVFEVMDYFQKIDSFYPQRNLSKPTIQERYFYKFVKKGLGKNLIEQLKTSRLPFVTTFFVAAYFAEYQNYPEQIYCIICDTDASRSWANINTKDTRVHYLLPSEKVKERFLMYGVKEENLVVTGFPLPKENIGENQEILKHDLARRLKKLDPKQSYRDKYQSVVEDYLDVDVSNDRPLTITYAVGGAGAQKEAAIAIIRNLKSKLLSKEMGINLVAGSRPEINEYFIEAIKAEGLDDCKNIKIIFNKDKVKYFKEFNIALRNTDILWTKPSELSFYCALGLPIIMSEPVGSQEDFNREWLLGVGAGIDSYQAEDVEEWLPDLLESGRLARAAMDGFLNAESMGTYNIEKIFS